MAQKGGKIEMPKGGSGFVNDATKNAERLTRGAAHEWRLSDPSKYTAEIVDLYKRMYESGVYMRRDSRGRPLELLGSDEAIDRASERIAELSGRMAKDVEVYNHSAAEAYSNLRQIWGQAVRVNSREMAEFRSGMHCGFRFR